MVCAGGGSESGCQVRVLFRFVIYFSSQEHGKPVYVTADCFF